MMTEGFLSYQEHVMNTMQKMGLAAGDGGVETVKLGSRGLRNEVVFAQDSVGDFTGLKEVTKYDSRWGSAGFSRSGC